MTDDTDGRVGSDEEFEAGAAHEGDYALASPRTRTYDGWHLPRKQVVRHAQWAQPLNDILDSRPDPVTRIKYLGLPGRDLLDVRHFVDAVCEPRNAKLEFLGFDRAAQARHDENTLLNSSYADLLRSPHVIDGVVRPDDIYRVGVLNSASHLAAKQLAPFDVVNLDFCEPVILGSQDVYPLLDRLFRMQRTNDDWLLLITSRVAWESADETTLRMLIDSLQNDFADCSGLEDALGETLGLANPVSLAQSRDLSPAGFFLLSSVLAGTWLLSEAIRRGLRLKVVSACGYGVYVDEPQMDMLSLSIRFQADDLTDGDRAGFVQPDPNDSCAVKERTLRSFAEVESIDAYMSDARIREHYTRESIKLVESCNHPLETYLEYLRKQGFEIPHPFSGRAE